MTGARAYWNINASMRASSSRKTERLRPLVRLGAMSSDLFVPRQALQRDPAALQVRYDTQSARLDKSEPIFVRWRGFGGCYIVVRVVSVCCENVVMSCCQ